jgi:hypothetical protein
MRPRSQWSESNEAAVASSTGGRFLISTAKGEQWAWFFDLNRAAVLNAKDLAAATVIRSFAFGRAVHLAAIRSELLIHGLAVVAT